MFEWLKGLLGSNEAVANLIAVVAIVLVAIILFLFIYLRNPFSFPYFDKYLDVSGRRNPDIYDILDEYIIKYRLAKVIEHWEKVQEWQDMALKKVQKSLFKKHREKQLRKVYDFDNCYVFHLYRLQTRYRQKNYVKTSYKVANTIKSKSFSYEWLIDRCKKLEAIGFETTLTKYNEKNQRSLMTKELKQQIKERDNYTCQHCGKYMPDEVGLHIDHIVPVARGGKSVASNLQVLCSKCNSKKGAKLEKFLEVQDE